MVLIAWASCPSGRRGIAIKAADAAATTARHDLPGETLSRDRRLFAAVEVGANLTSRTTIRVRTAAIPPKGTFGAINDRDWRTSRIDPHLSLRSAAGRPLCRTRAKLSESRRVLQASAHLRYDAATRLRERAFVDTLDFARPRYVRPA